MATACWSKACSQRAVFCNRLKGLNSHSLCIVREPAALVLSVWQASTIQWTMPFAPASSQQTTLLNHPEQTHSWDHCL
jgi:hypothetical protein